ncbi:P27 family phage terminase small subunit [Macrococcus armenti]|uniref:P27 family phage terminase small subunit n=1 Tax=Macrococcus armenti TaxID=2875764 RepID=UPI001CD3AB2F|nr:P27 family phage terminase small subunit [Macrococcus armenti]UBH10603.1 P27 family phage terminase small subunit [Macrococcus armenti]
MKFNPDSFDRCKLETKRQRVKKSLFNQLKVKWLVDDHYIDMVYDYLRLWDLKEKLFEAIDEYGITVPTKYGPKSNPAISDLHKTNQQMIKLLDSMGLKAQPVEEDDDDDDF